MEKEILTLEQVGQMNLPPLILYAVPIMLSMVVLEWYLSMRQNRPAYEKKDFWASVGIGIGNLLSGILAKSGLFLVILFFYNMVPWRIEPSWYAYVLCFITIDFFRYWAHRIGHESRFWWATHVPHHSSEHYNFSVTFRLSWTQHIKVIFFIPVALIGFDPVTFFICNQMAVLYQFWLHTELIKKVHPVIEYIFVTPSHHRVHHGTDEKYLDKNYGSSLVIWDRIFGTFQEEEERPTYGITVPVDSYNPVYLNFHEFIDIWKDLKKVKNLREAWTVTFGPPGASKKVFYDQQNQQH